MNPLFVKLWSYLVFSNDIMPGFNMTSSNPNILIYYILFIIFLLKWCISFMIIIEWHEFSPKSWNISWNQHNSHFFVIFIRKIHTVNDLRTTGRVFEKVNTIIKKWFVCFIGILTTIKSHNALIFHHIFGWNVAKCPFKVCD